jgi:membrane protein YdbS with pleckstrin-like domain
MCLAHNSLLHERFDIRIVVYDFAMYVHNCTLVSAMLHLYTLLFTIVLIPWYRHFREQNVSDL